jgi:hypothetical protein
VAELLRPCTAFSIGELLWWSVGIGYYPVSVGTIPYDRAYFERFARQAQTEIGARLMTARVEFVARHHRGVLCDVGIGCGAFVLQRGMRELTFGWDVNPSGLKWLKRRRLLLDPLMRPCAAISMWDVLEHIPNFVPLLNNVQQWLFLSLPIFRDAAHALGSKHFRPDEHAWYFTRNGLVWMMNEIGFMLIEENDEETRIGREDIMSFAFHRGEAP